MKPDRTDGRPLSTEEFSLTGSELTGFVQGGVDSVASLVSSTYGPRGMDKLVQLNGEKNEVVAELTSSGRGVLDAIERGGGFSHPIAAILVDSVDTMHRDLRDGTTTAVVLTEALLDRGLELIDQGLTPSDVLFGYALAAQEVGRCYDDLARPVTHEDTERLEEIARTMLSGRLGGAPDEAIVGLVVEAVQGLASASDGEWVDTKQVKVLSDPGVETTLHEGVVVTRWPRGAEASDRSLVDFDWESEFPEPESDGTVAIVDSEIEIEDSATNFGAGNYSGVHLETAEAVERYTEGVEARKRALVEHVAGLGVDVLVSQPRVDDDLVALFESAGVSVVDKVETPEADIDRLANATGATVVARPDELTAAHLGTAGTLYEDRTADEKWTHFTDCEGAVYTLLLRTPTERNAEHLTAVVDDALHVTATAIMDGQVLPGAGAAPMSAAAAIRRAVRGVGGREALAMSAFGAALEDTVRTLLENAGLDPLDEIAALRHERSDGEGDAVGIDVRTGEHVDAWAAGIVDPRRVPSQALETARTLSIRLLSTDAFLHPNTSLDQFSPRTEHH
jgi:chaperonin GroEL (HSP60 family)